LTLEQAGLLVVLGAVFYLDQWPAVQSMVSRPIVVGPLVGLVLNAPGEGAFWGAVFEVAYLGVLPVGAARYPDAGMGALVGTVVAVAGRVGDVYPAGIALVAGLAVGVAGERLSYLAREWNVRSASRTRAAVEGGDPGAVSRAVWIVLAREALLGVVGAAVGVGLAWAVLAGAEYLPWVGPLNEKGLRIAALVAAFLVGFRLFGREAPQWLFLGSGALLGAVLGWWVIGP
jgi:mannose/fructose/N-acetylgalactosamine-specific phosphotransferase system component IIC